MDEVKVVESIKNWIASEHPTWVTWRAWHFDVIAGPSKNQPCIAAECKGHPSERFKVHRAIGQCLDYTAGSELANASCFIAIPEEFFFKDLILKTLEHHKLTIGLLIVNNKGQVKVLRQGKESSIKE